MNEKENHIVKHWSLPIRPNGIIKVEYDEDVIQGIFKNDSNQVDKLEDKGNNRDIMGKNKTNTDN